jgi:hypothetical protein
MSWFTGRDTSEIISRDRIFRVALRSGLDIDLAQIVDVSVEADVMQELAKHGPPFGPQMNSHILNLANKVAWPGFLWWDDPIQELH